MNYYNEIWNQTSIWVIAWICYLERKGYQSLTLDEFIVLEKYTSIPVNIQIDVYKKSIKEIKVFISKLWLKHKGPLPLKIVKKLNKSLKKNIKLLALKRTGGPDDPKVIERNYMIFINNKFAKKARKELKKKARKRQKRN